MGRLTLNVLLSFAQFEREVTGERIRDKIAASKKKGMWMGRGALFHMLRNRLYLGQIIHKSQAYPGAHDAIIEPKLFETVQARLDRAARRHRDRPTRVATMALKGLLFDADGRPMSPTFAHGRQGRIYRYYVAALLQQGRSEEVDEDAIRRVPAPAIEALVRSCVARLTRRPPDVLEILALRALVHRVEVHPTSVQIVLERSALFSRLSDAQAELATLSRRLDPGERIAADLAGPNRVRLTVPCRMKVRGGRSWIVTPDGRNAAAPRVDPVLVQALRSAHAMLSASAQNPLGLPESAVLSKAPTNPYDRRLLRMAFLAPDIQRDILDGRQPPGLTLERLIHGSIPACWEAQKRAL